MKPVPIRAPIVSEYTPATNIDIATKPSDLSATGQKTFREDLEYYKILVKQYKSDRHEYEKEQASLQHIVAFIQSTVSPHLPRTCCLPDQPLRQWITNLKVTVGVDDRFEKERARDRYLTSLNPMRNASNWDTWLAEYDQAATEAEINNVPEITQIDVITKDFLTAVNKVAPNWSTTFQISGRFAPDMNRTEMMKRFREHMMLNHPGPRTGKHKATFVADKSSYLAESGKTTRGNERDTSQATEDAPSRKRVRPRHQRHDGQRNDKKSSSDQEPAKTGVLNVPHVDTAMDLGTAIISIQTKLPSGGR